MANAHFFISLGGGTGKTSIVSSLVQLYGGVGIDASPSDLHLSKFKESVNIRSVSASDENSEMFLDSVFAELEEASKGVEEDIFIDLAFNYARTLLSRCLQKNNMCQSLKETIGGGIYVHPVVSSFSYRSSSMILREIKRYGMALTLKDSVVVWFNEYRVDFLTDKSTRYAAAKSFAGDTLNSIVGLTTPPTLSSVYERFIANGPYSFLSAKDHAGSIIWINRIDEYQDALLSACRELEEKSIFSRPVGEDQAKESAQEKEVEEEEIGEEEEAGQEGKVASEAPDTKADQTTAKDEANTDDDHFDDLKPGLSPEEKEILI